MRRNALLARHQYAKVATWPFKFKPQWLATLKKLCSHSCALTLLTSPREPFGEPINLSVNLNKELWFSETPDVRKAAELMECLRREATVQGKRPTWRWGIWDLDCRFEEPTSEVKAPWEWLRKMGLKNGNCDNTKHSYWQLQGYSSGIWSSLNS